jgi:predicted small secreted protein
MRRSPLLMTSVLVLLAFGLAGCTTGGGTESTAGSDADADADVGADTPIGSGNVSASDGGISANGTSAAGNFSREWRFENRTGTIDAGMAPAAQDPEAAEESVTVDNGSEEMFLNISVAGADVSIVVRPPDCPDEACAQTGEASEDSPASFRLMKPAEGEWTVEIRWAGDDLVMGTDSEYDLGIATLVMTENGTPSQGPPTPPY